MSDLIKSEVGNTSLILEQAKELIENKIITKYVSPEKLALVMSIANTLGISLNIATQHIHDINGTITLSTICLANLAKKNGIDWEIIKDGEPVVDENGKTIDMITTIKFYRFNHSLNRIMENVFSFTMKEAVTAGLTSKDVWKKYPKAMLRSRCLASGIRFIAPDVIFATPYTTEEMKYVNGEADTIELSDIEIQ